MATMNPVELYHDPALDGLIQPANLVYRNAPDPRKTTRAGHRSMSDDYGKGQAFADVPIRSAPATYTGVGQSLDPNIHRSFSQRVKGRPFAEEAFMDDDAFEEAQNVLMRRASNTVSVDHQQLAVEQSHLHTGKSILRREGKSTKAHEYAQVHEALPSEQIKQRSNLDPKQRKARAVSTPTTGDKLAKARTDNNAQQGKWAHDRSPLQKLEVKLTDISKEEKRARVQEAELKLMRKKKEGKVQERRRRSPPRKSASESITRGHKPITQTAQDQTTASSHRNYSTVKSEASSPQAIRNPVPTSKAIPRSDGNEDRRRTFSIGSEPTSSAGYELANAGPLLAKAVSLKQQKPRVRYQHDDRPVTQHERNASHQAALAQLTGSRGRETDPSNLALKPISGVRPKAKDDSAGFGNAIGVDLSSMAGETLTFDASDRANAHGASRGLLGSNDESQTSLSSPVATKTVRSKITEPGLGLQNPKALESIDSPPPSLVDASKQRQRKSSVSFKEPFDRRRPIDEWKGAVAATLTHDDFDLRTVDPTPVKDDDDADLNTTWWEKSPQQVRQTTSTKTKPSAQDVANQFAQPIDDATTQFSPRLHLKCGPLLRYCGLRRRRDESSPESGQKEFWRGSIMIVTQDSQCSYEELPTLRLFSQPKQLLPPPPALVQGDQLAPEYIDPIAGLTKLGRTGKALYVRPVDHIDVEKDVSRVETDNGIYESSPSALDGPGAKDATSASTNKRTSDQDGERSGRFREVKGVRIYADPDRDVTFWRFNLEIELGATQQHIGYRINKGAAMGFWVPAMGQTMNVMFHSCNGFSISVNSDQFSGPDPLWRDVLNNHQTRPFHVMLGGGDQIYNDRVTVDTHWFSGWTKIKNPHTKHQAPFTNEMKEELESFYLERYCMWFSQGLFALANSSIPMVNMWDDHDIIDGFGSYPHDFMKTAVFSGLGNIAYKYYLLFQHQSIEAMTEKDEPSWLLGHAPGPYIHAKSRNVFLELGQGVAFLGIDCRTERTKNDVMSIDTLELILDRCRRDMVEGRTKHLIVLLGVPIAYPRLVWLENILTSRAIEPLKALGRAGILKPGLLNKFDGGVEILDDLDDHWTASHHKDERNVLIQELQDLAAEKSARITILSGDVHLAAIGQFYSNPKLKIPKDKDHRYMPNIISSAIVNTPPPDMMADVLNKRNKIHHLDEYTDENMIPMFTHDVDRSKRNNTRLLPRRNWCSIREYLPGETPPPSPSLNSVMTDEDNLGDGEVENWSINQPPRRRLSFGAGDLNPMKLVRRLSSRRAPPSSYPDDVARPQHLRSASFDETRQFSRQQQPSAPQAHFKAASADHIAEAKALRPSFHRRPTNLSEKAARKGIVPAVDAEGNEIDVNDHINLEGGLDIVINCEVNKKDPSGITLPYRFLVPALWYDGSSDREKLNAIVKPSRKATVLNKFGLGLKPKYRSALAESEDDQDDYEPEHDDQNEHNYETRKVPDTIPRRTFSWFGSKNKRSQPLSDEDYLNAPLSQPLTISNDTRQNGLGKVNQINAQQMNAPSTTTQPLLPPTVKQQQPYPPPMTRQQVQADELQNQKQDRPPSLTIGGGSTLPYQIPLPLPHEQFFSSEPHDADAEYVRQQQRATNATVAQPDQRSVPLRTSSNKQARILAIETNSDYQQDPSQTQLRGNGILGKNMPPTAYRTDQRSERPGSSSSEDGLARGYSGIEAYREPKSRRRWSLSLRDRARGLMNSIEGRNRAQRNDMYSDDEEEEFWEGPRLDNRQPSAPAPAPQQQTHRRQLQQLHSQQYQQQPQSSSLRGHAQQTSQDRSYRQWGPVYSYEKGRVFPYDNLQQARRH